MNIPQVFQFTQTWPNTVLFIFCCLSSLLDTYRVIIFYCACLLLLFFFFYPTFIVKPTFRVKIYQILFFNFFMQNVVGFTLKLSIIIRGCLLCSKPFHFKNSLTSCLTKKNFKWMQLSWIYTDILMLLTMNEKHPPMHVCQCFFFLIWICCRTVALLSLLLSALRWVHIQNVWIYLLTFLFALITCCYRDTMYQNIKYLT